MKLNTLAEEQRSEWKDRVAIVPLSIDAELSRVKTHAQGHGWTNLEHYWTGGESGGDFEAPAAKTFVVSGVPTALLIGTDGRILWRGHPLDPIAGQNVNSRIEAALKSN